MPYDICLSYFVVLLIFIFCQVSFGRLQKLDGFVLLLERRTFLFK